MIKSKKVKIKESEVILIDKHKGSQCGGPMAIAMFNSLVCKNKSCVNFGLEFMDMGGI